MLYEHICKWIHEMLNTQFDRQLKYEEKMRMWLKHYSDEQREGEREEREERGEPKKWRQWLMK